MRRHWSFSVLAGILALTLASAWPERSLSAQFLAPGSDSTTQTRHKEWSTVLRTQVLLPIVAGVKGLAYLFRPAPSATHRNLWQRREHPELWRSTPQEREAARAALPLVGGVALFALLAWGAQHLVRARRNTRISEHRERRDRNTPVAFAGSQ